MNPERETRTRALAALFATAALVFVSGPRAAVQDGPGSHAGELQREHGSYHTRWGKLDRVARVKHFS